jgi:hypothetical protein
MSNPGVNASQFLLPPPSYRPGIGQVTLDFPDGRVAETQTPEQAAIAVLNRELGIETIAITRLVSLNNEGWSINSSFSNQNLYGFVAHLDTIENIEYCFEQGSITYPVTPSGV